MFTLWPWRWQNLDFQKKTFMEEKTRCWNTPPESPWTVRPKDPMVKQFQGTQLALFSYWFYVLVIWGSQTSNKDGVGSQPFVDHHRDPTLFGISWAECLSLSVVLSNSALNSFEAVSIPKKICLFWETLCVSDTYCWLLKGGGCIVSRDQKAQSTAVGISHPLLWVYLCTTIGNGYPLLRVFMTTMGISSWLDFQPSGRNISSRHVGWRSK